MRLRSARNNIRNIPMETIYSNIVIVGTSVQKADIDFLLDGGEDGHIRGIIMDFIVEQMEEDLKL